MSRVGRLWVAACVAAVSVVPAGLAPQLASADSGTSAQSDVPSAAPLQGTRPGVVDREPGPPTGGDLEALGPLPSAAEVAVDVAPGGSAHVVVVRQGDDGPRISAAPVEGRAEARREAARALDDPRTVAVEVDKPVHALGGDPRSGEQWGLRMLGASTLLATGATGRGITVAVVDSGVDASHPDLDGAVVQGVNTRGDHGDKTSASVDLNGHGTHVAGIIAARADNGIGGAGIAPEASILPVKVLDPDGGGWISDVAQGIVWAVDQGASVINLSLGGEESNVMTAAVTYALESGVVVVAASGNEASGLPSYPAAISGVLSVAAVRSNGKVAEYSNFGSTVDLQAPGDEILSTVPDGYASYSGTSMASPFVAGAAALVRSARPDVDAAAVLLATARPNPAAPTDYGVGIVDPVAALAVECGAGCATPQPTAAPAAPAVAQEPQTSSMRQRVAAPASVRMGRSRRLPAFSDLGVPVKRYKILSKIKCRLYAFPAIGEWQLQGKRRGWCRVAVTVPAAKGIERLDKTLRVKVVGAR